MTTPYHSERSRRMARFRISIFQNATQLAHDSLSIKYMQRIPHDWKTIQAYYDEGHGFVECSRRFGFTHTARIKAIKRCSVRVAPAPFADRRRRYNWTEVQTYYDAGHSYRQCKAKFGFCAASWTNAIQRGDIKPRSHETAANRAV